MNYVWYASYGSNINRDRFYKYITGGQAEGCNKVEVGCTSKELPIREANIILKHQLIFAEKSERWNGGVAFLNPKIDEDENTVGRMYLIGLEQFKEIVQQENNLVLDKNVWSEFEGIKENSSLKIVDSKYGKVMRLSDYGSYPVYTFTTIKDVEDLSICEPSKEYLEVINKGKRDAFKSGTNVVVL